MPHSAARPLVTPLPSSTGPARTAQTVSTSTATISASTSPTPPSSAPQSMSCPCIKEVWASNLRAEMAHIQQVVERYRFISVDTEFPGVVVTPLVSSELCSYHWNTIRCNVNILKLIQLGLTFSDQFGNRPPGVSTWQFNFKFDVSTDMYAQDSLEMLEKAGLDFDHHRKDGIDVNTFAELIISSGLVLGGDTHWIAFHSGYDFGYLLKVLTNADLPEGESEFLDQVQTWFGHVYDVKYLIKNCPTLNHRTGLNQLAAELQIERIGPAHQAGSDSLITCALFFRLCQGLQPRLKNVDQYASILYGLGQDAAETHYSTTKDTFQLHPAHSRALDERMEVF